MSEQTTGRLMMIRPVRFRANEETAVNNFFQSASASKKDMDVRLSAQNEFDVFVSLLRVNGIEVLVFDDIEMNDTPDSIYPNNWMSTHDDGTLCLYPMFAENRRRERRNDIVLKLSSPNFIQGMVQDFTLYELQEKFLEGTGSLVLDRVNRIGYATISERTHPAILEEFGRRMNYRIISFHAFQNVNNQRLPIYHTNVMMCIGSSLAIICPECIDDPSERIAVMNSLRKSGKEILEVGASQVENFAGNMLEVQNSNRKYFMVMSTRAFQSLEAIQISAIEKHCTILHSSLDTIETCGGGSARCMMAEIFSAPHNVNNGVQEMFAQRYQCANGFQATVR